MLTEFGPDLASLESLLSPAEKLRAARFIRQEDRDRFIVAHGVLRQILGRYLSLDPVGLVFETGEFGKPAIVVPAGLPALSFNMAHSGDAILYVIANGRRVGVDVEAVRSDRDFMALAESQFAAEEVDTLRAAGPDERTAAFYRCWTLKEAYVKARGEGLGFSLKQFAVTFGASPAVRWASDDPQVAERWSVFGLSLASGYAGALIVEGRPMRLVSRQWGAAGIEPLPVDSLS
jgi:4'-phosphopantetheinyl transferase